MFLDVDPFPKEQWYAREREYSNWVKIADVIYGTKNTVQVLRILQIELMCRRRPYVLDRLYSRFSALRAKDEKKNMHEFLKSADPLWGDKTPIAKAFRNWHNMHVYLQSVLYTTAHLKSLLHKEFYDRRRPYMVKRLYGRFSILRMQEEKK